MYKGHIIPFFNPFIGYEISCMGEYSGIFQDEHIRENPIIVSLTSYRERFDTLPIALYSLLNQSLKPDKVILWLDKESEDLANLPYEITRFIKNGLEIRFVRDIKSYTKAIYAFKEFHDAIIVTADDDIYYRKDWLRRLYYSYIAYPEEIHAHRVHKVGIKNGQILPYEKWKKQVNQECSSYDNFLTGVGGVLYPPKCFTNEIFREDIFLKYSPDADDLWFWTMALIHNRKIRLVKNHYKTLVIIDLLRHLYGKNLYDLNKKGGNDIQLQNLMNLYSKNVLKNLI